MQELYCEKKQCINGYWDFLPEVGEDRQSAVPDTGWLKKAILVPSFWTKSPDAVKKPGETAFHSLKGEFREEYEYLLDGFGYPADWSNTRSAWLRRSIEIEKQEDVLYLLYFEGVMPCCSLFVNGTPVGGSIQPALPFECDITDVMRNGCNEVVLQIMDYPRDAAGRVKVPTGNFILNDHCGIWQDAWLITRPRIFIRDIRITTSVERKELQFRVEMENRSGRTIRPEVLPQISSWENPVDDGCRADSVPGNLPEKQTEIPPGDSRTLSWSVPWESPRLWSPDDPWLYGLRITLNEEGTVLDDRAERFGFREIRIEGPNLMLNGSPVRLFSDWGHKMTPFHYTEGWIRQWFAMMKDTGMNHSRLHTHPHPPLVLDLADEEGILITGETGMHGSHGQQAADCEEYWDAAEDHIKQFVRRDKNHPCIILWSVENEMRWNFKSEGLPGGKSLIEEKLPELRRLFNRLDPTRPAYHEGDSSLWNEKHQDILSRHYGKEVSGSGWWDRKQPLLAGEMSLIHYAGPNNTLHLGGDDVYRSWDTLSECIGMDSLMIIEDGRANGVCGFGPWNLSCLERHRDESGTVHLSYDDYETPGMKPLIVPGNSSEFPFWKEDTEPRPGVAAGYLRKAFRPVALIDVNRRTQYTAGDSFSRTVTLVNDSPRPAAGNLEWGIAGIGGENRSVELKKGDRNELLLCLDLPACLEEGEYSYYARFLGSKGELYDSFERTLIVAPVPRKTGQPILADRRLFLLGDESLGRCLEQAGFDCRMITGTEHLSVRTCRLLVIGKNRVIPGSRQNRDVRRFLEDGGRVLVMEQTVSLFPVIPLEQKAVQTAFPAAPDHEVLEGFTRDDFRFWGDASYSMPSEEACVATHLYRKDDAGMMRPLLETGEGGFGQGDLDWTPLWEGSAGSGKIIASQLRLSDCCSTIPAARRILSRLLEYLMKPDEDLSSPPASAAEGTGETETGSLIERAYGGERIFLHDPSDAVLVRIGNFLKIDLAVRSHNDLYQVVKAGESSLLSGISNSDCCGIESWCYSHSSRPDVTVARKSIALNDRMTPLLVTATDSPLKEMYIDKGLVEPLRAHTLSLFHARETSAPRAVCFSLPVGEGEIVVNYFDPPEEGHPRLQRVKGRLTANLGLMKSVDLLEGESVPEATLHSKGFPERDIHILSDGMTEPLRQEIIEASELTMERMMTNRVLSLGNWKPCQIQEGTVRVPEGGGNELLLHYRLYSPISRKNTGTNLSVPNPDALTFLEITAGGTTELAVNGRSRGILQGDGVFSDIAVERGINHILLFWKPETSEDTVSMVWRNIHHQTESGFRFDGEMGACD